jgi:hypothetical protein
MTEEELEQRYEEVERWFEESDDEYIKFERVENKRSSRPDLHAFMLLAELVPGDMDIVCSAEHDEIYLQPDIADLVKAGITREQVVELARCGVRTGDYGLCMFV